jgi:hypothetical protein
MPVTWVDVVEYAKTHPEDFQLSSGSERGRVCSFFVKGYRAEIGEDDWRLIVSGALDRFGLLAPHPMNEDEAAEQATLDIVEQSLQTLIRKADEVARKARQLNYHLSGRKAAITARRPPAAGRIGGFQPANPSYRASQAAPYDIHTDLLSQFSAAAPHAGLVSARSTSKPSSSSSSMTPSSFLNHNRSHSSQAIAPGPRTSSLVLPESTGNRTPDDAAGIHRGLVQQKLDKAQRGDAIFPPCDRCRRLKLQCIKHLTACQGCTKKHAKCSWKAVTDEEAAHLRADATAPPPPPESDGMMDGDSSLRLSTSPRQTMGLDGMLSGPVRSLSGRDPLPERVQRTEPILEFRRQDDIQLDGYQRVEAREDLTRRVDGEPRAAHSLLSHMASIATAQAETAETSRGSSTSRE